MFTAVNIFPWIGRSVYLVMMSAGLSELSTLTSWITPVRTLFCAQKPATSRWRLRRPRSPTGTGGRAEAYPPSADIPFSASAAGTGYGRRSRGRATWSQKQEQHTMSEAVEARGQRRHHANMTDNADELGIKPQWFARMKIHKQSC